MTKNWQILTFPCLISLFGGCAVTQHPVQAAEVGIPRSSLEFEALLDQPGPVEVETVVAADWQVSLAGMLNLEHQSARAAGLEDREEPIQIYFHALRHPSRGLFIVDSGVERALANDRDHAAVRGIVADVANVDQLHVRVDTRTWLERQPQALAGVFLTHLHLDHVLGLPDVPPATPIFTGPGEAEASAFMNLFVQSTTNRTLEGHAPLLEWQFEPPRTDQTLSVLDIVGDGSIWALHVPGHTPGSTAYVARTAHGSVLMVGDACHTRWGWQHAVEPGTFSSDGAGSRESLLALLALAKRHPSMEVRFGHQPTDEPGEPSAKAEAKR